MDNVLAMSLWACLNNMLLFRVVLSFGPFLCFHLVCLDQVSPIRVE